MITLFGGRTRSLRLGRWSTLAIAGALPLLAAWYLGATLYFVFHDQLLSSLMSHQMDMQYSYEDRIAALRAQLDRETSRGLLDRRTLDTTIRDLAARGDQLAARAATIDALVNQGLPTSRSAARTASSRNPLLAAPESPALPAGVGAYGPIDPGQPSAGDLRLDRSSLSDGPERHSELTPQREDVAAIFDRIETSQAATLSRLREPLLQSVDRMTAALADVGVPAHRLSEDGGGLGGPFVPLPANAAGDGFETDVALLQDAVRQKERLDRIVERVPLRRPLEGPLEVTSTFGARVDPFLGRPAMHTGIDLHEESGDAVESTAAGIVTIAGSEGGYGNMVEIDHGNGLATRYAHLSAIDVVPHQMVPAGFIVGRVGSTGRATGPHLHYETRINGEPVDPARYLRAGAALFPG